MHTDEWIAKESREDRAKTHGFSLKQEEYQFPLIKLTFGEEYIPIPQNRMITRMVAGMETIYSLKKAVYCAWCLTAAKELGISREEVIEETEGERTPDGTGSDNEKAIFAWIEKKIQNDGPYEVLGRAIEFGYDHWYDGYYVDIDEPYEEGTIGEVQEWEKEFSEEKNG